MKNPKQIMSTVTITHDMKEVTIDGVEFWTKFYEEGKSTLSVLKSASDGKFVGTMLESNRYTYGVQAVEVILSDFESMMLADAKAFTSGVNKLGELNVDDYIIAANSLYLTSIGVLMEGMAKMIDNNIARDMNVSGLAGVVTVMLSTCNHFIEKEYNNDTV